MMKALEYSKALIEKVQKRTDIIFAIHPLHYKGGDYELLRIVSADIHAGDRVILIRAGIHGDEIAGPETILDHLDEIVDRAHRRELKVIIYPLGNPSGFENGLRYNIDGDKGDEEIGNNDFCRYVLSDGKVVDDLVDGFEFESFRWSSDVGGRLAEETRVMHELLKQEPWSQVSACIDLHQDYIHENGRAGPAAYHYAFGDLGRYAAVVAEIKKIIPLLVNETVGSGEVGAIKTDENGFIVRHEGSLPALFVLLGAEHGITVETTGSTPSVVADAVNMAWISGIIDLVSA